MAKTPTRKTKAPPAFAEKTELTRYVFAHQVFAKNRPAPAVFRLTIDDAYLSVNSVGLAEESITQITDYYRLQWQNGVGKVRVAKHKLAKYNDAGRKAGMQIGHSNGEWKFTHSGVSQPAYVQVVVASRPPIPVSRSHTGVMFVRLFNEDAALRFARRLCKQRFHLL